MLLWSYYDTASLYLYNILLVLDLKGLILGLRPANERLCCKVTLSLIGWAQTYIQPCLTIPYVTTIHNVTNLSTSINVTYLTLRLCVVPSLAWPGIYWDKISLQMNNNLE